MFLLFCLNKGVKMQFFNIFVLLCIVFSRVEGGGKRLQYCDNYVYGYCTNPEVILYRSVENMRDMIQRSWALEADPIPREISRRDNHVIDLNYYCKSLCEFSKNKGDCHGYRYTLALTCELCPSKVIPELDPEKMTGDLLWGTPRTAKLRILAKSGGGSDASFDDDDDKKSGGHKGWSPGSTYAKYIPAPEKKTSGGGATSSNPGPSQYSNSGSSKANGSPQDKDSNSGESQVSTSSNDSQKGKPKSTLTESQKAGILKNVMRSHLAFIRTNSSGSNNKGSFPTSSSGDSLPDNRSSGEKSDPTANEAKPKRAKPSSQVNKWVDMLPALMEKEIKKLFKQDLFGRFRESDTADYDFKLQASKAIFKMLFGGPGKAKRNQADELVIIDNLAKLCGRSDSDFRGERDAIKILGDYRKSMNNV